MERDDFDEAAPGEIVPTTTSKGTYSVFRPDPLPPSINTEQLITPLAEATQALGRLHGIGPRVGSREILIEPFIRKEALESSQIEGTHATLSDIYAYEAGQEALIDEDRQQGTQEVVNYLHALMHGLDAITTGDPITVELLCEMHDRLLSRVRGDEADPGELRTTQNFIGSTPYIQDARYVPPPPDEIPDLLEDLLKYANQETNLHPLLRIGLIHYQFETIHPFLDGNGRLGRLLISLLLQRDGLLPESYLYLSSYFNARRSEYVDHLLAVSQCGDWEEWLLFFLRGVQSQADEAHQRANLLVDLREDYQQRYQSERSENILELVMRLFEDPYLDVNTAADWLDVEYSTANRLIGQLGNDEILEELTGKDRNRVYRASEVFQIINKPIDQL
ncbi:Fic family protein [Halosegnis rubeus]|uniref:Fic family protein n=2 Tax=Halosegnis rubeus TaxID=2212850 RepID=A0A5N5U523_9EURY|nr:Fic family protein [Halosegnis rubeus]KAB7512847.1 Fic family protein [Halosegnis rubeus]KAB7512993.1 Fic family protein [Halosegnis rubeus]KAB7513706.1 Fic family protein [Halosegnis rubeus]